ncbi:MAG: sortase, partial [Anaerolineales bacterium]
AGLTYVPGSLTIVSGPAGGVTDDTAAPTLRVTWANFPLLTGSSRTEAVVQFQATLGNLSPGQEVQNTASLAWTSLPGDVSAPQSDYNNTSTERYYDPLSPVNVYGVQASIAITVPRLPRTGFAPGVLTDIPPQPADKAYTDLGDFWLEIPKLGVKMPIVGIPAKGEEWDLTWLWDQAGWLEGTAYPTHAGNSALTAHVYLPNGQPGPFLNLGELRWGDQVIVHLGGQRYIYEVRQVRQVSPYSLSPLRHEDLPWLTLITCREYDARTNSYRYRVIVRAVLIKVVE